MVDTTDSTGGDLVDMIHYVLLIDFKSSNSCSPSGRFISNKSPRVNESCLPVMCFSHSMAWMMDEHDSGAHDQTLFL